MKKFTTQLLAVLVVGVFCTFLYSCQGDGGNRKVVKIKDNKSTSSSTNKSTAAPETNEGADVPAEQGGKGFPAIAAEQGWETNTEVSVYGSPDAKKGGALKMALVEYPATLRTEGKDSRSQVISIIGSMVYEGLLGLDAKTLKYTPSLASHWKISEDKMTYSFRIDPRAKWSDGKPVVAKDVVATWKLLMDPGIEDPSNQGTYGKFNEPVAKSKYIVEVKCKEQNWRNFLYFSGSMKIFPAHHLEKIDGAGYLKKYQYQMLPGTGPYIVDLDKTKKPELLVLKRRTDYWAANDPTNVGTYNFDELQFVFILDDRLKLEKFKKGDFDYYEPSRAQWWKEELNAENIDNIKRGLIQKRKIFNSKPLGTSGLVFNTLEAPFDDIKVRKAFAYAWNVDELNEKLFYDEYVRCVSYYQGSVYQNPSNPIPTYNPDKAVKLLEEAGYKKKAGEKYLFKDGKPLEVDLEIIQSFERILTPYQQDLEQIGVKLNLKFVTPQARFEKMLKRQFKMSFTSWTGLFFPNPESSMHSDYAEKPETNNVSGMKEPKIDRLCERYDASYDISERIQILQEVDKIAVEGQYYAFGWVAPYGVRCVYWNKFDMPEWGLSYTGDFDTVLALWWYDEDKAKQLDAAIKDKSKTLKTEPVIVDYWNKRGK